MSEHTWTWGDMPERNGQPFEVIVPDGLMLPDNELPGYDPTEDPGFRAAWLCHWMVSDGSGGSKVIHPSQWRIDTGEGPGLFEVRALPDELLRAALEEIALRPTVYATEAARVILTRPGDWRVQARRLIQSIWEIGRERISKYNAPRRSAFMRIPPEFADRIKD